MDFSLPVSKLNLLTQPLLYHQTGINTSHFIKLNDYFMKLKSGFYEFLVNI